MALDEQTVQTFRDRVEALRGEGPGRFNSLPMHNITVVRLLREVRDEVTVEESAAIAAELGHLKQELHGLEEQPKPPAMRLSTRLSQALKGRNGSLHQLAVPRRDEGDVPGSVTEAAEAWLIAAAIRDRVDDDLSPLRQPWESVTIRS